MKRRPIMTGVVTEEWTRHLGMFLDDLDLSLVTLTFTLTLIGLFMTLTESLTSMCDLYDIVEEWTRHLGMFLNDLYLLIST